MVSTGLQTEEALCGLIVVCQMKSSLRGGWGCGGAEAAEPVHMMVVGLKPAINVCPL